MKTNVLSKSSTLTREMTVFARTADTYLHLSLSTLKSGREKSMLLTRIRIGSFLPASVDRADLLFFRGSVLKGSKLPLRDRYEVEL